MLILTRPITRYAPRPANLCNRVPPLERDRGRTAGGQ